MQETWVRSLVQEDPLEKEMVTHSSVLTWEVIWAEKPGRLQSMVLQESDRTSRLNHHQGYKKWKIVEDGKISLQKDSNINIILLQWKFDLKVWHNIYKDWNKWREDFSNSKIRTNFFILVTMTGKHKLKCFEDLKNKN